MPVGFWKEWHAYVREINPEVYSSAEIWGSAANYLRDTDFIAAMNYRGFAIPIKGWLIDGKIAASEFAERLDQERNSYDGDTAYVLQNLVDSHDTQRVASAIRNRASFPDYRDPDSFDYDDGERVYARTPGYDNSPPESDGRRLWKMLALFQATYVGAPMIYYGTEVGMWGADDPEDRMPTWWHRMDDEIFKAYQMPLQLRHQYAALRRGEFEVLETRDDSQIFIFERRLGQQRVVVVLNRGKDDFVIDDTSINGLDQLYSTDPSASALRLPRLSGAVFGTKK